MSDALRFVESCIDRYAEQAWRTAYVMLSNAADADDLLQQAFMVAWRKADAAPRENAWPWLATIIAHEARNFRRKRSRRRAASLDSVSEPAMEYDPDKQLQRAELSALVHVSLAALGEEQRIAIVLTHLSGLSQTQAADALGVPLNTLKARVRRGLETLREALGKSAPSLEGTLKNLPIAPPVGGMVAAKAAWTAGLASNVALAGGTTATGLTIGMKLLIAASVSALILAAGITGAALQPDDNPKPYVASDVRDEPGRTIPEPQQAPDPLSNQLAPTPVPEPKATPTTNPASVPPTRDTPTAPPEPEPIAPPLERGPDIPPTAPYYRPDSEPSAGHASDYEGDDEARKREDLFGKSFTQQVEEAVDKGCDWLMKQQGIDPTAPKAVFGDKPEGPSYDSGKPHQYWIARAAFPVQALCSAGCFVDEPAIDAAMNWLRENYREEGAIQSMQGLVPSKTYEDATVLMAVEAYYISQWETHEAGYDNPKKRFTKNDDGEKVPVRRWGTEEKGTKRKKPRRFKLDRKDQKICEIAVRAIEARFRKGNYGGGGWRYDQEGRGTLDPMIDVSATQYALLGLKCATRLGIKYDKGMLVEAFRFLRGQQDKDGPEVKAKWLPSETDPKPRPESSGQVEKTLHARGWGYCRQSGYQEQDKTTYGSMTAAAINTLILIRDEMVDDPGQRKAWEAMEKDYNTMIGDGLGWIVHHWSMQENPGVGMYHYYYHLCAVERLGMLGGIDEIGGHDWYYEGARQLMEAQSEDASSIGMWDIQNEIDPSDVYNTCYALLFLKRTTARSEQAVPFIAGE